MQPLPADTAAGEFMADILVWDDGKPCEWQRGARVRVKSMITSSEGGDSAKALLLRQSTPGTVMGTNEIEVFGKRSRLYIVMIDGMTEPKFIHEARIESGE